MSLIMRAWGAEFAAASARPGVRGMSHHTSRRATGGLLHGGAAHLRRAARTPLHQRPLGAPAPLGPERPAR